MKRALLSALMITLLLAGCGGEAALEERLEARRDEYAAAETLSFTAEITANLGNEIFPCTLACTAMEEETRVEVLEPSLVAGVTASLRAGETELRYEGLQLSFGAADAAAGSPMAFAPLLTKALRSGHIIRAWRETGGEAPPRVAAEIYIDDTRQLTVWYDSGTLTPQAALLSSDGEEAVRCTLRDFTAAAAAAAATEE